MVFSILDHALRRNDDESQKRVIGALLGTRSEDGSEIEIRSSFAVHHSEADDHITLDVDYYKRMQILHTRVNPQEVLVGWYATSHELDNVSPLIHNFFSDKGYGTWPHPAVHVTVSTEPGKPIDTHTYISAPLWVKSDLGDERALFVPVPHEVRYTEAEKTGMDALTVANNNEDRVASLFSDMEILEKSICEVLDMIDRVGKYVEAVLDEEAPVSAALGQFLLNALAVAPYSDFEENLFVQSLPRPPFSPTDFLADLDSSPAATTIYKTFLLSPTSATKFARKWNSQTSSPPAKPLDRGMKCTDIIMILQIFLFSNDEHVSLNCSRRKAMVCGFSRTCPSLITIATKRAKHHHAVGHFFFPFSSILSAVKASLFLQ